MDFEGFLEDLKDFEGLFKGLEGFLGTLKGFLMDSEDFRGIFFRVFKAILEVFEKVLLNLRI